MMIRRDTLCRSLLWILLFVGLPACLGTGGTGGLSSPSGITAPAGGSTPPPASAADDMETGGSVDPGEIPATPERPSSTSGTAPTCDWDGIGVPPPGCEGAFPRHCPDGLAILRDPRTDLPVQCGCPAGTEPVIDQTTQKPVGCLCPSGDPLQVIRVTGEGIACEEERERDRQATESPVVRLEEPREGAEPECRTVYFGEGSKPVRDCRTEEQRRADERREFLQRIIERDRIQDRVQVAPGGLR